MDTPTFIFLRDFLCCLELIVSQLIFFRGEEKRRLFLLRLLGIVALAFGFCSLAGYLISEVMLAFEYSKASLLLTSLCFYLIIFPAQMLFALFLYKTASKRRASLLIFSFVFRQVVFSLYVALFTLINPNLVFFKYESATWANCAIYLGFYLAFYLAMFFVKRNTKSSGDSFLDKPIMVVLLLSIAASVVLYVIGECYSREDNDFMYCLLLFSNVISLVLISSVEFLMRKMFFLRNENMLTQQLLQERESQFKFAKANMEKLHIVAHDLKHQTAILREGGAEAEQILDNIDNAVEDYETILITENQTLNVILNEKWHYCQKHSIRMSAIVDPEALRKLGVLEMYTLFGNLLDNAIEATRKLNDKEKRTISLKVAHEKGVSLIDIRNYFSGKIKMKEGAIATSKGDAFSHGYGLKSVKAIIDKYGGDVQTLPDGDVFIVKIIIPD